MQWIISYIMLALDYVWTHSRYRPLDAELKELAQVQKEVERDYQYFSKELEKTRKEIELEKVDIKKAYPNSVSAPKNAFVHLFNLTVMAESLQSAVADMSVNKITIETARTEIKRVKSMERSAIAMKRVRGIMQRIDVGKIRERAIIATKEAREMRIESQEGTMRQSRSMVDSKVKKTQMKQLQMEVYNEKDESPPTREAMVETRPRQLKDLLAQL